MTILASIRMFRLLGVLLLQREAFKLWMMTVYYSCLQC